MQRNRSRFVKVVEMMLRKLLGASNIISGRIFDRKCCVHAVQASFLARLSVCTPKTHQHDSPSKQASTILFSDKKCSQTCINRCKTCLEHLNSSANQRFTRYKELSVKLSNVCLDGELVFFWCNEMLRKNKSWFSYCLRFFVCEGAFIRSDAIKPASILFYNAFRAC